MKKFEVITPEQVKITYELAGLGSRAAALGIDLLLQCIALLLLIAANIGIIAYSKELWENSYGWFIGISLLVYMLITYVYFIATELRFDGQTVGKRIMAIKVMRLNGQAAGGKHILIRNLFKVLLDAFGFGVWMLLFQKDKRRIGDLVAGTVVVHVLDALPPLLVEEDELSPSLRSALSEDCLNLYHRYLAAREALIDDSELKDKLKTLFLSQCRDQASLHEEIHGIFQ